MAFRREHIERGERKLYGCGGLEGVENYGDWLAQLRMNASPRTVKEGWVPASQYLCVRKEDGRLVGMINIRHELNEYLFRQGGHIGYMIHASERRKGYATRMLALALDECRRMGLGRVLVTCDRNNVGSARTIQNNGGVLENETTTADGSVVQRYWIDLQT